MNICHTNYFVGNIHLQSYHVEISIDKEIKGQIALESILSCHQNPRTFNE